jgi:protein SCO1/2
MMRMNTSRLLRENKLNAALIGAALAILVLASAATVFWLPTSKDGALLAKSGIGGPFTLVDHHGKSVSERDYLGKPTLVFFGFTNCPDVCPTTLFELTSRLAELGSDADRLNVLFITVDPERDTPQQLGLYLSSFDPRITGLSGTPENISEVMTHYRVYARKIPLEGGDYAMDHTAAIYMMNAGGKFVGLVNYQEPDTTARAKLRRLIDFGSAQ